jgi:hypothetical protein
MGHDLPRGVWDRIIDAIGANARRARVSDPHEARAPSA